MFTDLIDGTAIGILLLLACGLFFFGIGPLTDRKTWLYRAALWESAVITVVGAFVLLTAIMMVIT